MTSTHREILRLAVPALGALAADPVVILVDTAFVGRLGTHALASLGVAGAVSTLAFFAFNFLQYGVAPMIGTLVGADRRRDAADVARHAMVIALGLGVVMGAITAVGAPWFVDLMAAPPESVDGAVTYLRVRALAAPALMAIMVGNGAFRGHQDTVTPLRMVLILNLVNLVLDPLFIFTFGWGLGGAALATVVAQLVGASGFLVSLWRRGHLVVGPVGVAGLRPFAKVGWALAVRTGSLVLVSTVVTRVAGSLGAVVLAAHQVANQIWLFLSLVVDSLAIAAQSMISIRIGRGDTGSVRRVAADLDRWALGVGVALTLVVLAVRPFLPGWFSDDPEVLRTLSVMLLWVAALQIPGALVFVWDGVFLGASRFPFLARAMVLSALCALAVLATVRPAGWGFVGLWAGIAVMTSARLVTLAWGRRTGRLVGSDR